jgi:hypothetical protein
MTLAEPKRPPGLEKGQLWKLREEGYLYIAARGKRLIHYKLLKQPAQRRAPTRMVGFEALEAYLKAHQAELVSGVSAN